MEFRKFFQRFSSNNIPVGGKIFNLNTTEFDSAPVLDSATMEDMLNDELVTSMINLIAAMVEQSYNGVYIEPTNPYLDEKITDKELKVLEEAARFNRMIKIKKAFFDIAYDLVLLGDTTSLINISKEGVDNLEAVPNNSLFFVGSEEQVKDLTLQVKSEKFLYIKKDITDTNPKKYTKDQFIHFSYKNRNVWRTDIDGRTTYGIYSIPILASLQNLLKWKRKTMENDIIWKNKLMPRILHELDLSEIVPNKYTGTQTERLQAAEKDAQEIVNNFIASTKQLKPDDDLVQSQSVKSSILEASSTNYQAPNQTIDQINNSINTPLAIPHSLLGGSSASGTGIETIANFANIKIESIAELIADSLNKALHIHLKIVLPTLSEEIDRTFYAINASLPTEKFTNAKTALAMAEAGIYTKGEIRNTTGFERLPQLPAEAFLEKSTDVKSSSKELVKNILQTGNESQKNNQSPESVRNTTESNNT
jgi:hypothetical protein